MQDKSQNPTIEVPKFTTEALQIAMPGPSPILITDLYFQHLHVVMQPISRTFPSCKTEILYPLNNSSLALGYLFYSFQSSQLSI